MLPHYAAGLGDLYAKLGLDEDAREQYERVEQIVSRNALNQVLYNRALARFYADHDINLDEALRMAGSELERRRDIYTHDVLAWTLYKKGRYGNAVASMTEALKLGTKDARLLFHAGMVHERLGNAENARSYLRQALSTNPHFDLIQAFVAKTTLRALGGEPSVSGPRR